MRAGVLLAGGASRRMGRPKPLVVEHGETFLAQAVRHLWITCDKVYVVLGARARQIQTAAEAEFQRLVESGRLHEDLARAHRQGSKGLEVQFVVNPRWAAGMYGSVRIGLELALHARPSSLLVLPVDHPEVRPATLTALADAMDAALAAYGPGTGASKVKGKAVGKAKAKAKPKSRNGGSDFAYALVPRYRKRRGHPIALSPALAREVAADREAQNLSDSVRRNARLIGYLDCPDPAVVRNRNTPED